MKRLAIVAVPFFIFLMGCEQSRVDAQVRELCAKDGGIKVYETVTLPAERFDQFGRVPMHFKEYAKQDDEFFSEYVSTSIRDGNPSMWRSRFSIIRAKDGKVLGELIRYSRRGGDIPGPWHDSSFSCPPEINEAVLEKKVFLPLEKRVQE